MQFQVKYDYNGESYYIAKNGDYGGNFEKAVTTYVTNMD